MDRIAPVPTSHPPPENQTFEVTDWERSHVAVQSSTASGATPYQSIRHPINGDCGAEMLTPPDLNQPIYSDALPFDNLDIEEIWNWMSIENLDNTQVNQYSWE
jgi:hypothetical protein